MFKKSLNSEPLGQLFVWNKKKIKIYEAHSKKIKLTKVSSLHNELLCNVLFCSSSLFAPSLSLLDPMEEKMTIPH